MCRQSVSQFLDLELVIVPQGLGEGKKGVGVILMANWMSIAKTPLPFRYATILNAKAALQ